MPRRPPPLSRRIAVPLLLLLAVACDDGDPMSALTDASVFAPEPAPQPEPEPTACDLFSLAAQCPPGSNPTVTSEGCVDGATITDDDGVTTGVCAREGECLFACNFAAPCQCGVDRITNEGVFCSDCRDAAACGDAICEGGESPATCPVDCGVTCAADNERCRGNARQECEENGRWVDLDCRDDQICQFGADANAVVTVCQTRISMAGGTFPGFGQQALPVQSPSTGIRFRERALDLPGIRFVNDGARVLARGANNRLVILDPTEQVPVEATNIVLGGAVVASPNRIVRAGRWPQVSEFFDDTSRSVEPMVHDGAGPGLGAIAISGDDRWVAAAFSVGLAGQVPEAVLGIWRADDGRVNHLVRFVDQAVVSSTAPATVVALSIDGAAAVEARPGGVLIVWNVQERRFAHLIQSDVGAVTHMATSVAGDDLLVVAGDRGVALWSIGGEPSRRWFVPLAGSASALAIAPDSSAVAVASTQVLLLDAADGAELYRIASAVTDLDFDPRGGRLLVNDVIYATDL